MSHKKKKMKKKIIKRKVFYQSQMNINFVVEGAFGRVTVAWYVLMVDRLIRVI